MLELMWKSKAKRAKENEKGFTLVELIVVVAIIGILAAIGIARLGGFGDSAREKAVESEHRMLISAVQMWQSEQPDINSFPATLGELDPYTAKPTADLSKNKAGNLAHELAPATGLVSSYEKTTWTYKDGLTTSTPN